MAYFQKGKPGTVVMLQIMAPPVSSQPATAVAITMSQALILAQGAGLTEAGIYL